MMERRKWTLDPVPIRIVILFLMIILTVRIIYEVYRLLT